MGEVGVEVIVLLVARDAEFEPVKEVTGSLTIAVVPLHSVVKVVYCAED